MEQVEINGLLWDKDNTVIDDKEYFTWTDATEIASKLGKRLPTKEEWEKLYESGMFWRKDGSFFGNYFECKIIFLPAKGMQTPYGYIKCKSNLYYWSSTWTEMFSRECPSFFYGSEFFGRINPDENFCKLPIRLVQDINKSSKSDDKKEIGYDKEYLIKYSYISGFMEGYNTGIFNNITRSEALKYAEDGADNFFKCQSPELPLRNPIDVK